jgi:hypothetical protein
MLFTAAGVEFTVVAHRFFFSVFFPAAWTATIKNSMINTFLVTLAAETKNDKVRVNVLCIHYGELHSFKSVRCS